MADSLLEADRELTPEGELRWRFAARKARQALIADGLMAKSRPGLWELTEAGPRGSLSKRSLNPPLASRSDRNRRRRSRVST